MRVLFLFGAPLVALIGTVIGGILIHRKVRGALLISMVIATVIGIPLGVTNYAGGSYLPSAPYFFDFAFGEITADSGSLADFVTIVFIFLFDDMFNTMGTLVGCAGSSGMLAPDGSVPHCGEALLTDAIGTTVGSVFGTSTVTTFVESSAGVVAGGRTGLTALVTGVLFLLSLFLSPLFASIPSAATASALILVGVLMIRPVRELDFSEDMTEAIPSFVTILLMICTSSIPNGIMFGVFSYVLLKLFNGKGKEISLTLWIVCAMFAASALVSAL